MTYDKGLVILAILVLLAVIVWSAATGVYLCKYSVGCGAAPKPVCPKCRNYYCELAEDGVI